MEERHDPYKRFGVCYRLYAFFKEYIFAQGLKRVTLGGAPRVTTITIAAGQEKAGHISGDDRGKLAAEKQQTKDSPRISTLRSLPEAIVVGGVTKQAADLAGKETRVASTTEAPGGKLRGKHKKEIKSVSIKEVAEEIKESETGRGIYRKPTPAPTRVLRPRKSVPRAMSNINDKSEAFIRSKKASFTT